MLAVDIKQVVTSGCVSLESQICIPLSRRAPMTPVSMCLPTAPPSTRALWNVTLWRLLRLLCVSGVD